MGARAGGAWRPLGGVGTCMGSCGRVVCRGGTGLHQGLKKTPAACGGRTVGAGVVARAGAGLERSGRSAVDDVS